MDPDELRKAVEEAFRIMKQIPIEHLNKHAEVLNEQERQTSKKVEELEYLLGRHLTLGETYWLHRRLHYGLRFPDDALLDFDFNELDAAYRERLSRSGGPWRGPLDDLPPGIAGTE